MSLTRSLMLAVSMLILGGVASAHAAQKVGVAAAVNPDAFASGRVVNLGKSIFYNEQVKTSANGLVQVLLVDGSTFTVGPNSNLVIDKFVYDPAKGQGEMVATFSKGALRFVGGKLSKKDGGVTVKTPQGALAIRGGIAQIQVSAGGSKFLFDFGDRMQLKGNDGQTHTIFQPGNLIDITGGSPFVRPTNPEDTQYFLTQLASKPGQSGGAGQGGGPSDGQTESGMGGQGAGGNTPPPVGSNETNTQIFTVKIEDATSDKIEQEIIEQIDDTPPPPVDKGDPAPPPVGDPPPPPPFPGLQQVQVRVLSSPEFFTSFVGKSDERHFSYDWYSEADSPGDAGILGGDDFNPEGGAGQVTSDDFITTATIVDGFLTGSVQFVAREFEDVECGSECGYTTVLEPVKQFAFTFNSAPGIYAALGEVVNVVDGVAQAETVENFIGSQVVAKGFSAHQMYGLDTWESEGEIISEIDFDDPLLIVSGQEYVLPSQGKLHSIELLTEPRENQNGFVVPFASADFMPEGIDLPDDPEAAGPLPAVSNLLLLEKDGGAEDTSQSVWLQTSFYISPTGGNGQQQSFAVVTLGGVEERDGFQALVGERRGGSQTIEGPITEPGMRQASFAGGVATLAGGGGAHLMGEDGVNVVIGPDGHEIFIDRPLESEQHDADQDHQYATYHIGTQNGPAQDVTQTEAVIQGYAVGIVNSQTLGDPNVVMSRSPSDVSFEFDPETNTLSALLKVRDVNNQDNAVDAYGLKFGGIGIAGRSAFIDDRRFAAIESMAPSGVGGDNEYIYEGVTAENWLASGDQLDVTNFFPSVFEESSEGSGVRPFCQNCDFIRWGAWGTRVQFGSGEQTYDDNVHAGWWVAGDITTPSQLDGLAQANMSATYNGHAIGNVVDGDQQRIGAGDLNMSWDFALRSGQFRITNFDGDRAFRGLIGATESGGHFAGALNGHNALSGDVRGSFVNDAAGNAARGVIGNFQVGNGQDYRATGIFAGSGTPIPGQSH